MSFTRNFSVTALGIGCSRLLGFVRDASIAWLLGATPLSDAMLTALRLPDIARRLLGDGTLSMPITLACGKENTSPMRLGLAVGKKVIIMTVIIIAVCLISTPLLATLLAPGLPPEAITRYLYIALPYIVFAMAAACGMGILHAVNRFTVPAVSPFVFNLCALGALAYAYFDNVSPDKTALLYCCGFLAGGLLQTLINCTPPLILQRKEPAISDPAKAGDAAISIPVQLFTAATPQLILALTCIAASTLSVGSVSMVFYAERIVELPLGVCAAALGMAASPSLASAQGAFTTQNRLTAALTLSLCLTMPATAGLAAIGAPLIRLLFLHGAFGAESAEMTINNLYAFLPAIPAYAVIRPLLVFCHAQKIPMIWLGSLISMGIGIGTGFIFVKTLDISVGAALGGTCGLWGFAMILLVMVSQKTTVAVAWGLLGLCASASLAVYGVAAVIGTVISVHFNDIAALLCAVPCGIAVYLFLVWPAKNILLKWGNILNS